MKRDYVRDNFYVSVCVCVCVCDVYVYAKVTGFLVLLYAKIFRVH